MTELVAALARAQANFGPVKKSKTNKHFGSNYADLADVIAAVVPALNKEGIAVVQPIEAGDLVTRLLLGDDILESRVPLSLEGKPQEIGSELTYMRRYCLAALLGVASEDDDDGNAAQDVARPSRDKPYQAERDGAKASAKQVSYLDKLVAELVGVGALGPLMEDVVGRACDPADLTTAEMSKLIDHLVDAKKAGKRFDPEFPEGSEPF